MMNKKNDFVTKEIFIPYENDFIPKKQFIAYLDILGYEQLIKEDGGAIKIAKKIDANIKGIILSQSIFGEKEMKFNIKVFSDNFIICSETRGDIVFILANILQINLATDGIFINGSICYGTLLFNDNFICGQGIIDAYKIQSEIAIFPRIIVDDSFILKARNTWQGKIKRDFDGYAFVDYLRTIMGLEMEVIEFLSIHSYQIDMNIMFHALNPRVLQKYQWCKNYHNEFCKQYGYENYIIE